MSLPVWEVAQILAPVKPTDIQLIKENIPSWPTSVSDNRRGGAVFGAGGLGVAGGSGTVSGRCAKRAIVSLHVGQGQPSAPLHTALVMAAIAVEVSVKFPV